MCMCAGIDMSMYIEVVRQWVQATRKAIIIIIIITIIMIIIIMIIMMILTILIINKQLIKLSKASPATTN